MQKDTFLCPVCNGMNTIVLSCPRCNLPLKDRGRYLDLFGEYSPYRPIDDTKKTDGWPDLQNHTCPHQVYCEHCGYEDVHFVKEEKEGGHAVTE